MTAFEGNESGEPLIEPGQNHHSIRDTLENITGYIDFDWRQNRLVRYGATALAIVAGSSIYSNHASADQTSATSGAGIVESLAAVAPPSSNSAENAYQSPASATTGPVVACASPSPRALKATAALFNAEPYRLSHAPAAYDHARVIVNPSADFISLPDTTVAKHYGLTDPPYGNQLFQAFNSPSFVKPQAAIQETEAYLGKFGVQVEIGATPGELDGFTTPTQAEIEQDEVKALGEIDWDISESPTKYIHLSGLRRIILTGYYSDPRGFYWADPHTLVWNMVQPSYEGEMNQAVYEGIDATECGFGNANDPNYAALNGRNIYGSPKASKGLWSEDHLILDQPTAEERRLGNAIRAAYDNYELDANGNIVTTADGNLVYEDPRRICRLDWDFNDGVVRRIAVEHRTDFSSAEQDKDDLGALFSWSANGYNAFLDSSSPILHSKALFLLARLYQLDPNIVKYFAGFSGRPDTLGGVVDCTKYGYENPPGAYGF